MSNAYFNSDAEEAEHKGFGGGLGAKRIIPYLPNGDGSYSDQINPSDKIPTYDLYISYNTDGTINQKIWKVQGTSTVVKTLTYNYSGGNLISKTLS